MPICNSGLEYGEFKCSKTVYLESQCVCIFLSHKLGFFYKGKKETAGKYLSSWSACSVYGKTVKMFDKDQ